MRGSSVPSLDLFIEAIACGKCGDAAWRAGLVHAALATYSELQENVGPSLSFGWLVRASTVLKASPCWARSDER